MPSRHDPGIALFVYRWLMRAYPATLRARFSSEWASLFRRLYLDHRRRGRAHAALFVVRNLFDALVFGLTARLVSPLRRSRRGASARRGRRASSEAFLTDLKLGARFLRRQKLLSATVISCLALGIGSTTAVFSLFDALVVRPLPVSDADRLVGMTSTREHGTDRTFAYRDIEVLRAGVAPSLALVAYASVPASLRIGNGTERIWIELVSGDYFEQAGVTAAVGRLFGSTDGRAEAAPNWERGVVLERAATGFPAPLSHYRPYLTLSMALVALVLALAAINVSGLLLAAGEARRREIVTRQWLGAGRARLLQQLFTEHLLLTGLAGALGCGVAVLLVRVLTRSEPMVSRLGEIAVGVDGRVLVFALAATLVSAMLSGLASALSLARGRGGASPGTRSVSQRSFGTQRIFLGAQVALSFTLLVGAALSVASLDKLRAIDPGVEDAPILMASIDLRTAGYAADAVEGFWTRLLARTEALPAVTSAALTLSRPVDPAGRRMGATIPGYVPGPDEDMEIDVNNVSPGYFPTLGIDIVEGRGFATRDERQDTGAVAIVNETAAARYWPGQSAVGHAVRFGFGDLELLVVGVARDGKYRNLREAARPLVYLPHGRYAAASGARMTIVVRTAGSPLDQLAPLRSLVSELDPAVPLFDVRTLEHQLERAIANDRLTTYLFSSLAFFALLLASVGLLGLLTFWVRTRRHEIGIRMAVGARPADVAGRLLGVALPPVAVGLLLGGLGALLLGRFLDAQLYGVRASDPRLYLAAAGLFIVMALTATLLPVRQATHVQPLGLLRVD